MITAVRPASTALSRWVQGRSESRSPAAGSCPAAWSMTAARGRTTRARLGVFRCAVGREPTVSGILEGFAVIGTIIAVEGGDGHAAPLSTA